MTLHLIKLCVGIEDVAQLRRVQARRLRQTGRLFHRTRMTPRRGAELLDGGSLYWVIRGRIRVRQRLTAIEREVDAEGRGYACLVLAADLVRCVPRPQRAFQGWRYLHPNDAPADLGTPPPDAPDMPQDMVAELRQLGLI